MLKKLYTALDRYMKTNARHNLEIRSGWRLRLEDIYVACHRLQNRTPLETPSRLHQHHAEKK
jgi:hypothetical protein